MKRTQIYLADEQTERLDQRAADSGATRSQIIRQAVDAYLEQTAGDGADARLKRFRQAVRGAAGVAPDLPPGNEYVERLRDEERLRQEELDRRRRT